eukprot:TRINITY_DN6835_c0_g1_i1.p2 TRINITY_DN6835_c0_g1~~TRINITY_DN6835_c0_g1_i1.p2  ORF type:complete len:149 (-),score=33.71 TRINITY_DN6835_c0_g1_i1:148-540(-)
MNVLVENDIGFCSFEEDDGVDLDGNPICTATKCTIRSVPATGECSDCGCDDAVYELDEDGHGGEGVQGEGELQGQRGGELQGQGGGELQGQGGGELQGQRRVEGQGEGEPQYSNLINDVQVESNQELHCV